ncbi:MAG: hypothetical protein ACRDDY_18020 [Clostridium sp.]|uniref:hypothetical protein n=1 Tax=Clostridium sp. TaxID=1506 RepID=UPI003EE455D4
MKSTSDKIIFKKEFFLKKDKLGFVSMNILGDSISHGANVEKIYEDSWVALLKQKFMSDLDTKNYGFINCLSPISNEKGIYNELIIFKSKECDTKEENSTIGFYDIEMNENTSSCKGSFLLKKEFSKIYLKLRSKTKFGKIKVLLIGEENVLIKENIVNIDSREDFLVEIENERNEKIESINIINIEGKNVFSGIYLIEEKNMPVINNYSRSGLRISNLNDEVLNQILDSNIVIFSLGYNKCENVEKYIDRCKELIEKFKPRLIILDFCWSKDRVSTSKKLKKFAEECSAIYIDFTRFNEIKGFLSDKAHPTKEGHKIIFKEIIKVLEEELK